MLTKEQLLKQRLGAINEAVFKHGDVYKVKTTVDIPKSLINAFVSKSKKEHGKDPKEQWSEIDMAEMFVTYIMTTYMNIDSIPVDAIMGDTSVEISTEVTNIETTVTDTATDADIVASTTVDTSITPTAANPVEGTVEGTIEN